ncbi:M20/M25/M40 family metallo-hydrolase [bacterium]|nr:M20/M25/M40 family metallo-hydrolase [bacterium]
MKKLTMYVFHFIIFVSIVFTNCKTEENRQENISNNHLQIQMETTKIFDSLVQMRRDLHQYPELSGEEKETANKIEKYLIDLGLDVKTNIGGYGVVGILEGKQPGPILAWRAEIDAFRDNSPDVVDFPSQNAGIRHICGHDVHTTIGLGIANVLYSLKNEFSGTVLFIFQPAEENWTGAKSMIQNGIFIEKKPEAIFALHVAPLPIGQISVKEKEMFWKGMVLRLELRNGNEPDKMINDCITIIKGVSTVSEDSKFFNPSTIGDSELGLGSPKSIFADYLNVNRDMKIEKTDSTIIISVLFEGSSKENHQKAMIELKNRLQKSNWKDQIESVVFSEEYPTVYNDPVITSKSIDIIKKIYGANRVLPLYGISPYNNDDFALFQQQVPGVYFFLGASNFEKGIVSMPNAPNFAVDEKSIEIGIQYFSSLLFEYLKIK